MLISKELPPEKIVIAIDRMIKKLREEENPEELKIYRKIFKKKVPFNLRGYFIGYLLKELIFSSNSSIDISNLPSDITHKKTSHHFSTKKRDKASVGMKRLFVSIGRNRRVRRNELLELFMSKITLKESDFGEIRILNYYSFLEVPESSADDAIFLLSGISFKGRRITVDFAREKN